MHIVTICEAEAATLLAATQDAADQIKEALAATQPQAEDSKEDEEFESFAQASSIDAVRAFFEEHHRRKAHVANDDHTAAKIAFDQGKKKHLCMHTSCTCSDVVCKGWEQAQTECSTIAA